MKKVFLAGLLALAFGFTLGFSFFLSPAYAGNDEITAKSRNFNIVFRLPSRWTEKADSRSDLPGSTTIGIPDKKNIANITFYAEIHDSGESAVYETPRDWALASINNLQKNNWYNNNHGAKETVSKRRVGEVMLGSGEKAILIQTELHLNQYQSQEGFCQIAFLVWNRNDRWYSVFIFNWSRNNDLGDDARIIAKSISYLTPPQVSVTD